MSKLVCVLSTLVLMGLHISPAAADVTLPPTISNGMVVQREAPVRLWGRAAPAEAVTANLAGKQATAAAAADGRWEVQLPAMGAGGPHTLIITGRNRIEVKDVLVGDVWLASGQSNMAFAIDEAQDPAAAKAAAGKGQARVRFFVVPQAYSPQPVEDVSAGHWEYDTAGSIGGVSALAYHTARRLSATLGIPIGFLQAAHGGSRIESWMSDPALRGFKPHSYTSALDGLATTSLQKIEAAGAAEVKALKARVQAELREAQARDEGMRGHEAVWSAPKHPDEDWDTVELPTTFQEQGRNFHGIAWFRRSFDFIPDASNRTAGTLSLGRLDESDSVWLNGNAVGAITDAPGAERRYPLGKGQLLPGRNVLVVRITNVEGDGGFHGAAEHMRIELPKQTISLAGAWRFRPGARIALDAAEVDGRIWNFRPTLLYNAMIYPLRRLGIRGVLWSQGGDNRKFAQRYSALMSAWIADWRALFGAPELPFLWVQEQNYGQPDPVPVQSMDAELREAQRLALSTPHTGMATTLGLGDPEDVHYTRKQEAAERLAQAALVVGYGKKGLPTGPLYLANQIRDNRMTITFEHVGRSLKLAPPQDVRGAREVKGFAIAGADRHFRWAKARIVGKSVEVWHPEIASPVAVRYGWSRSGDGANVVNEAGLPASSFRTDNWPGLPHEPARR